MLTSCGGDYQSTPVLLLPSLKDSSLWLRTKEKAFSASQGSSWVLCRTPGEGSGPLGKRNSPWPHARPPHQGAVLFQRVFASHPFSCPHVALNLPGCGGPTGFLWSVASVLPLCELTGRQTAQPLCSSHIIVRADLTQTSAHVPGSDSVAADKTAEGMFSILHLFI